MNYKPPKICRKCRSRNLIKCGFIDNKQRWKCKNCKKYSYSMKQVSEPITKKINPIEIENVSVADTKSLWNTVINFLKNI